MGLVEKLRRARERDVSAGGYTFTVRRPTDVEMVAIAKAGTVLAWLPHVVGWKGVREIDLIPGGDPHPLEFSAEVRDEWLADRPDLLGPLVQAMGEAYQAHADALGAAAKN